MEDRDEEDSEEKNQKIEEKHVENSEIYADQTRSRSGKTIPFLLGVAAILLILGGAFYFLKARPGTQESNPLPKSINSSLEESPSPSPQLSFDRSKYTLRVLNGTKRNGLAASTSAKLKDLGYKIERTGNATNSAFLKTVVRLKPNLEEFLENLIKDLSALDFEPEEGSQLKDSDTADGEVILGVE